MVVKKTKDNVLNALVLAVYAASLCIVTCFHEPWFDEIQAYLIARDASIYDIIFTIPHYEGHPFLWHLYLVPFARSPLPFEIGLKSASIILNVLAMGLFVYKAPFKRMMRYTIPFTYYFFFLYGIVSRCYSITMLGFVFMAITYKNKDKKPFLYILAMAVTCLSSAYGIVFCGGLAIVWLINIVRQSGFSSALKRFFKDRRLIALSTLLIFALMLIYLISPNSDTIGTYYPKNNPFVLRLFYMMVLAPTEAVFTHYFSGNYHVSNINISTDIIASGTVAFILLAFILYVVAKSKSKLKELIIPYIIFSVFSALMYFTEHHIGNITYFLMFILWICFDDKSPIILPKWLSSTKIDAQKSQQLLMRMLSIFAAFCIMISLYWTASVVYKDVVYNYDSKRDIAHFIKEYDMEDALIMSCYSPLYYEEDCISMCLNVQPSATVNAYFDNNIIYSLNDGKEGYIHHFLPNDTYIKDTLAEFKSYGAPDILLGKVDLEFIFDKQITYDDYSPVYVSTQKRFTKDDFYVYGNKVVVYLRNDLLDYYGLQKIAITP